MTTGVPIYLVSACTTGEEFVAAFRRYADRGSLFVPIAEPIPTGRRGRFAVTLSGGGVMLEGDGEVISSAKTPSILHGRIGMTIRFGDLDDASKTVLIELEKARLATKPPAPSVAPRTADVPAQPRAVPPPVSARIDASTALAQCVAIGDVDGLGTAAAAPPKAGPKFVMPAVLPVGQPRPKTPSSPPPDVRPRTPSGPQPVVRPKTPSIPPAMPNLAPLPATAVPSAIGASKSGPTGVPIATSASQSGPTPALPGSNAPAQIMSAVSVNPTPTEMTAVGVTAPMPAITPTKTAREDQTRPSPIRAAAVARREEPTPAKPLRVAPPPSQRTTPPIPIQPPTLARTTTLPLTPSPKIIVSELDETTDITTMPEEPIADDPGTGRRTTLGVAVSPSGMVLPAMVADPEEAKPTELVEAQPAPISNKLPAVDAEEAKPTEAMAAVMAPISNKLPVPTIEEATPSGDWTITPGAAGPTIEPRSRTDAETPTETPVVQQDDPLPNKPAKRQTGDWTIQLDSGSPDGWSEPSKLDIKPIVVEPPPKPMKPRPKQAENPPELAPVARSIMVESQPDLKPVPVISDEPKIQIDPTLMEAPIVDPARVDRPRIATPMPIAAVTPRLPTPVPGMPEADLAMVPIGMGVELPPGVAMVPELGIGTPVDLVSAPVGTPDPRIPTPVPGELRLPTPVPGDLRVPTPVPGSMRLPTDVPMPTPVPGSLSPVQMAAMVNPAARGRGDLTDGGTGFFRESGEISNLSSSFAMVDPARGRRTRIIVIAVSAALVLAVGIVLLMTFGDDKKSDDVVTPPPVPIDAAALVVSADAAEVAPVIDAAEVKPPPPDQCTVEVTSVPPAADIVDEASATLGTTPATLPLPCGKEVKLTIKKLKFASTTRPVTPTVEGAKLRVLLQKLMFQIKVSSQPTGANVSLNGKSAAITPSVMKVPAFELSTVTFSKDGYEVMSVKVTPKQNNQTVFAQLKKKPPPPRR